MSTSERPSEASEPETSVFAPRGNEEEVSETDFLDHETEAAKAAILRTIENIKGDLRTATDVRLWTQEHPWAAVGVAAAVGFTAAMAAAPAVARATDAEEEEEEEPPRRSPRRRRAERRGARAAVGFGWLLPPLVDLAKTAATAFIHRSAQS